MQFGLAYDFRNPARWAQPAPRLYAELLEQIVYAERLGFDAVWLPEHHFVEDGYTPSPLTLAAAIAARTARLRIGTWVLLLPLHHPLRVAEDAGTVDILSNGRLDLGLGLGYRREEFAALGVDRRQRGRLMDEGVALLRRAWTEERVTFAGRCYAVEDLPVTPRPVQRPHPPLWLAARSAAAARRAARFGAGLAGLGGPEVYQAYAAALRARGADPAGMPVLGFRPLVVTDDPERTRAQLRERAHYMGTHYDRWFGETADLPADAARLQTPDDPDVRRSTYLIGPADEVAAALRAWQQTVPYTHLVFFATPGGMPPAQTTPWLERFAREVIPRFKGRRGPPAP
jgi:probable F420-dependent oxidoreductase